MKTILPAKEHIAQLWGHPKAKDIEYRFLKYLLKIEVEAGLLLHNVVTGQLILLSQDEARHLSQLPTRPTEQRNELISDHFLVPNDFDEYRSVKQLRKIFQSRITQDAINHYVILPTTFCNAHCFYCYESDYPRVHMTEETARKLISYIDEHRQGKDVSIQWFGGEPLVGIERIDQISKGLAERGISFSSSMISNGYLFDETIIERSVTVWNLKRVQITLDGTESVYNHIKAFINVKESPFQRVLRNIDLLSSAKIHVNIRLNIDFHNKDDIRELIEELGRRYSGNRYVTVYANKLFDGVGYEPINHSYEETIKLMGLIYEYTDRMKDLRIAYDNSRSINLQFCQCMADNPQSIMIQPDGSFCRCEHENINENYGNLTDGIQDPQRLARWKETAEILEKCPECVLYPACYHLSHCMDGEQLCVGSLHDNALEQAKERIRTIYTRKEEVQKDERVYCS